MGQDGWPPIAPPLLPQVSCDDPLGALTAMCKEMPTMADCAEYHAFCAATTPDMGVYCAYASGDIPPMTMWFHQRLEEVVLALGWITRTPGGGRGVVCVCFGGGQGGLPCTCS